jgi:single-stranded-DNA-specific exonuclease
MHKAINAILKSRGIDEEKREEFFSSRPSLAYDPFLLENMQAGVDLLLKAVDDGRRIVIYGDYDVDGITSTSLLMKVISSLTDNVTYYIPSRFHEGYGLHTESIDRIKEDGGELIVTVDCGAVSKEETLYAHSLGIDTLVTDHHNVTETRADGLIINPQLPEDKYPFKGLAGVGVAYKLALALSRKTNVPKDIMAEIVELATIGTIADIMPMLDENRTIVKCGLRSIHLGCRNKGLRRLIDLSGLNYKTLRASDVSFGIAPRINAAGRLGDAKLGVKLFLAEDDDEIESYCNALIEANKLRRQLQDEAYDRSATTAEEEMKKGDFLVLEVNGAHEGVLGIVAGKLREDLNRPVIIVSQNDGFYKGTGRSIEKVDLFDMLDKYRDQFISFGGHSAACGFSIDSDKIDKLRTHLNEDIAELYKEDDTIFDKIYRYDAEVATEEFNIQLAEDVQLLEPCGRDNEVPFFMIRGAKPRNWRYLKGGKNYAKFVIEDENRRWIDCLVFHNADEYKDVIEANKSVDLIGGIEINCWNDVKKAQMIVQYILPPQKDSQKDKD